MTTLLAMRDVRHSYNGRTVLEIPSLDLPVGSITGFAGPNGSGKTTLLKILSLVEPCSSGTVLFQGAASKPFADPTRHRVTMLLQEPYLLKRSVYENIAYGLKLRSLTDGLETRVSAALKLVGLPATFGRRQWHELSGGETQRVALAARLILKPDCLLLDEPTASVDLQSAERIKRAILLAREQWGTTIIISSHQSQWLQTLCDRILFLFNGSLLRFSPENIMAGPWQKDEDGRTVKSLIDGQKVFLPDSMISDCTALSPSAIRIITEDETRGPENILRGRLSGIFEKEKIPGKVNLHVLCGEQLFVLEMSAGDVHFLHLQIGQSLKIGFSQKDFVSLPC